MEPVQGVAGWQKVPPEWIEKIGAACRDTGTLLIMDEVQCGLGRCGHVFYSNSLPARPDIVLLGKGLAGGAYPLGAVIISKSAFRNGAALKQFDSNAGIGSTFSNNALGCAIASDVYDYIKNTRLAEKANELGEQFISISNFALKHRKIQEIRAVGFGIAIDFVNAEAADSFVNSAIQKRVLTYAAGLQRNIVKLSPPLTIGRDDLLDIVHRISVIVKSI
jgi:acetylornithine/succinyldiaminopimelate/putrescine aminotransferase